VTAALGVWLRFISAHASSSTVSSTSWTRYWTNLDVSSGTDTDLRFQVYVQTSGVNLDLDDATLQDARVTDAGFDDSASGWTLSPGGNYAVYSGASPMGSNYLETNATSSGGSVYQDVPATPAPGHSYDAAVMLRSPGGVPVQVDLVLWALGGPSPTELGQSVVTVSSSTWAPFATDVDVNGAGHNDLRLQVFVQTVGVNVDVDGARVDADTVGPTLSPLRQLITAIAVNQDQHRAQVVEDPLDSNCNPFSAYFGRGSTVGDNGAACQGGTRAEEWCSDFAQWVWTLAGEYPSTVTGWAFTWVNWGTANGRFKPGATNDPEPGDAVVWGDMGAQYGQHVGIVVGVADGLIDVVSGNSGPLDAQGNVVAVWESGYFDPALSSIGPYPIVGYVAPDGFNGT